MLFPENINYQEFNLSYRLQANHWEKTASEILQKHGIVLVNFKALEDGSNLVGAINDDLIIKIFPPFHRHQWDSEHKSLQFIFNKIRVSTPKLIAYNFYKNNWTYVIMTKLEGTSLEQIWLSTDFETKKSILHNIGMLMKEVHSLNLNKLTGLPDDWNSFIKNQLANYKERHTRNAMPEWFLSQLECYVNDNIYLLAQHSKSVFLTGEYTPFNLLVQNINGIWDLTAMIDFGDAMIGIKEYDLLGPLLFLCEGNKELVQTLLSAYGYSEKDFNKKFRKRLMLLAILHRYSNLNTQIRIPGCLDKAKNFEELEQIIWPL